MGPLGVRPPSHLPRHLRIHVLDQAFIGHATVFVRNEYDVRCDWYRQQGSYMYIRPSSTHLRLGI